MICQGTWKHENPTGKPDILGPPNPTQTWGVSTNPYPKPDIQNPRYFQGIQNTEILTKKVDIFV